MSFGSHDASSVTNFGLNFGSDLDLLGDCGMGSTLEGDFYREGDVTRSVKVIQPFHASEGAWSSPPWSDPYVHAESKFDITKGLSFPPSHHALMEFDCGKQYELGNLKVNQADVLLEHTGEFDSAYVAPLEREAAEHLLTTKVELSQSSPAAVGNTLLFLLREQKDQRTAHYARVNKVNPEKYTIRADVSMHGLQFAVKIRLYSKQDATVVEFQRRSGDSVGFMKFYRKVSAYLAGRDDDQVDQDYSWSPCESSSTVAPVSPEDAIAPLIDMAHLNSNSIALAEVASALCAMATRDWRVAEELRKPCGLAVLQQLQQHHDFGIKVPTEALCTLVC